MAFVDGTAAKTEDIDAEILGLEQGTAEMLAQARAARVALVMIEGHPHNAPRQAPEQAARAFTPPIASVSRLGLQPNLVTHPGLVNRLLDPEPVADAPEPAPAPEQPKSKLAAALEELAALEEQRRQLALRWLDDRRERAIDAYIKALTDLGPLIAEAAAADAVRAALGDLNEPRRTGAWLRQAWRNTDIPIPASRMEQLNIGGVMHPRTPLAWRRVADHSTDARESLLALFREEGLLDPVTTGTATDAAAV